MLYRTVLFLGLALGTTSCLFLAGGVAGAGAYYYWKATVGLRIEAEFPRVWSSVLEVADELHLQNIEHENDGYSGVVRAKRYTGEDVTIHVRRVGSDAARVDIRFGTLGHRGRSEHFLRQVRTRSLR